MKRLNLGNRSAGASAVFAPLLVWCLTLGLTLGLGLVPGQAHADEAKPAPAPKPDPDAFDFSSYRDGAMVVHDGAGHYLIVGAQKAKTREVFFGDGKLFYQQRIWTSFNNDSTGELTRGFWSPRVNGKGYVDKKAKRWTLRCGPRETPLIELGRQEADKVIEAATFRKPLWKRTAHALARDDRGNYYFVDRFQDAFGGKGHRLFKGPKGAMKEMPMTNIVADSVGEIYSTKKGELRFVIEKQQSQWISGKKKTDLTQVPPGDNVELIYSELGVYLGPLGTPCDDL